MRKMWASKEEWDKLNKKVAGLETQVRNQREIILLHIQEHEESVAELKQIINGMKEYYNGIQQTL